MRNRPPAKSRHRQIRRSRGFTLIEAALTTVIVGTGVLAIVAAQQAYHEKNDWAQRTGTAMLLANEIRELTWAMPLRDPQTPSAPPGPDTGETSVLLFDDLDDFAGTQSGGKWTGTTFSADDGTGPINALRGVIPGMDGWSQHVVVESVWPDHIDTPFTDTIVLGSTPMMRVTVTVSYQGPRDSQAHAVTTLSWIVTER